MSRLTTTKPLITALGAAFATGIALAPATQAAENPFAATSLSSGYMVADSHKPMEGKCGEGKCGAGMQKPAAEGKCGEGKCGAGMKSGDRPMCSMEKLDTDGDGKVSPEEFNKHHEGMFSKMDANQDGVLDADELGKMKEGKCGEGKCGAAMQGAGDGKMKEGKCGEGKCGGAKK